MTTDNNKYGDFPKPIYSPTSMSKVRFDTFCQCQGKQHIVEFDKEKPDTTCTVSCFHCMAAVARAYQYKNCEAGMVIFRGGKEYPSEVCTFRRNGTADDRLKWLKNILMMSKELRSYYMKKENSKKEGARMFSDKVPIVTTIGILALLQHYSQDINEILKGTQDEISYITTPMLDVTRDVRVAASFAMDKHNDEKKCVVRMLLTPTTTSVNTNDDQSQGFWEKDFGTQVQRLGNTNMLLIELATILPASAVRPLVQSGYLIVYENDLINFHNVRLEAEDMNAVMDLEAARLLVNDSDEWDALDRCSKLDVFISKDVSTTHCFFHELVDENQTAFPGLTKEQRYPKFDPMKDVLIEIATNIKNKTFVGEANTSRKPLDEVTIKIQNQRDNGRKVIQVLFIHGTQCNVTEILEVKDALCTAFRQEDNAFHLNQRALLTQKQLVYEAKKKRE